MRVPALLAATLLCCALPASAEDISRDGPEALTWLSKMTCGTTEQGVTRYGMFEGRVYSRAPGERDRRIFNLLGVNVRQCARLTDPQRGAGFRSVSREIMLFIDPVTDQVIDKWLNPWTNETVDVVQVANDPVNMRAPTFAIGADGKPAHVSLRQYGDLLASSNEIPLFYENPLGGDYQSYVGGQYHAMEIFNDFYPAADFLDARVKRIHYTKIAWVRISSWLPWMKMGDRQGVLVFNATGFSTFNRNELPSRLRALLDERYPAFNTPPPLDDTRPNETSWTVFKKYVEARKSKP